jgi:hypothetical protein
MEGRAREWRRRRRRRRRGRRGPIAPLSFHIFNLYWAALPTKSFRSHFFGLHPDCVSLIIPYDKNEIST